MTLGVALVARVKETASSNELVHNLATISCLCFRFYCKVYGIPDLDSFWAINDPAVYAWHIKIPCLCLSATDDPVISKDLICHEKFLELETMVLATVDSGAHCGFVDSSWQFWSDKAALDFVLTSLAFVESKETYFGEMD